MCRFFAGIVSLALLAGCGDNALVAVSPGVALVNNATASGLPTIVEFGAESCSSCRQMKQVLDSVAHRTQGRAHVLVIDISKDWSVAEHFRIQMMPTQVFFGPDGKETWRHMGKLSEEEVVARLLPGSRDG